MKYSHLLAASTLLLCTITQAGLSTIKWCPSIHERIIREALKDRLTVEELDIVGAGSNECDSHPNSHLPSCAHFHAMRAPGEDSTTAYRKSTAWFYDRLRKFTDNPNKQGLYCLGQALHVLTDATSPSHVGFQEWHGVEDIFTFFKAIVHVQAESGITEQLFRYNVVKVRGAYDWAVKQRCPSCTIASTSSGDSTTIRQ